MNFNATKFNSLGIFIEPNYGHIRSEIIGVWVDEYAQAIEFGRVEIHPKSDYTFKFQFNEAWFHVDLASGIWSITNYGVFMKIGRCDAL